MVKNYISQAIKQALKIYGNIRNYLSEPSKPMPEWDAQIEKFREEDNNCCTDALFNIYYRSD